LHYRIFQKHLEEPARHEKSKKSAPIFHETVKFFCTYRYCFFKVEPLIFIRTCSSIPKISHKNNLSLKIFKNYL